MGFKGITHLHILRYMFAMINVVGTVIGERLGGIDLLIDYCVMTSNCYVYILFVDSRKHIRPWRGCRT